MDYLFKYIKDAFVCVVGHYGFGQNYHIFFLLTVATNSFR